MKILKLAIFTAAVLGLGFFTFFAEAQAEIHFVAPESGGAGDCSTANDPCILAVGQSKAGPGETIKFTSGIYYTTITVNKSGSLGSPIIYEGTLDGQGNRLSIIDPATLVTGWVPADGDNVYSYFDASSNQAIIGTLSNGVWKVPAYGAVQPDVLYVEEDDIPYDVPKLYYGKGSSWTEPWNIQIAKDKNATWKDESNNAVNYWDGIEVMYASSGANSEWRRDNLPADNTLWIRFRNGDNPNKKTIRAATAMATVNINGNSYITIKDLEVRAARFGIYGGGYSSGERNTDIIIENNKVVAGQDKININNTVNATVRNNIVRMQAYSSHVSGNHAGFGSWSGVAQLTDPSLKYLYVVNRHSYEFYKYPVGNSKNDLDDLGIAMTRVAGAKIYGNLIYEGPEAFDVRNTDNVEIYDNKIYDHDSTGMYWDGRNANLRIYNNLFSNNNINIRFGSFESQAGPIYIYKNKFWDPQNIGEHMYFHYNGTNECEDDRDNDGDGKCDWDSTPNGGWDKCTINNAVYSPDDKCVGRFDISEKQPGDQKYPIPTPETVWIYHNSFSGGKDCVGVSYAAQYHAPLGMDNVYIINNVMSASGAYYDQTYKARPGDCAYNWVTGTDVSRCSASDGRVGNINNGTAFMWPTATLHNFALPPGSSAKNAGINLLQNYLVNNQPLPGITAEYYNDGLPDMGAFQSGDPADVNSDGHVNIKDIQICIKGIIDQNSIPSEQLQKCQAVALSNDVVNIKDIQAIIQKIVNPE